MTVTDDASVTAPTRMMTACLTVTTADPWQLARIVERLSLAASAVVLSEDVPAHVSVYREDEEDRNEQRG